MKLCTLYFFMFFKLIFYYIFAVVTASTLARSYGADHQITKQVIGKFFRSLIIESNGDRKFLPITEKKPSVTLYSMVRMYLIRRFPTPGICPFNAICRVHWSYSHKNDTVHLKPGKAKFSYDSNKNSFKSKQANSFAKTLYLIASLKGTCRTLKFFWLLESFNANNSETSI